MKAIADTSFLVASANRTDIYREWAVQLAEQVTEPLLTCEAVLAESTFIPGSALLVLNFVQEGLVRPDFLFNDHLAHIAELAKRYDDQQTRFRGLVPDSDERTAPEVRRDHH